MKEDGSRYTDVISTIQYQDSPTAIGALSDENITADVSYSFQRYMNAEFRRTNQSPICKDILSMVRKQRYMS